MTTRVQVLDLGASNLLSVLSALDDLDVEYSLVKDSRSFQKKPLVMPGTGDFGYVSSTLGRLGLHEKISSAASQGYGILGICLGAQLLLNRSDESPEARGLGLIDGDSRLLSEGPSHRVPSLGWQLVHNSDGGPEWFYFAHSYEMKPEERSAVCAYYDRGTETVAASIARDNVVGVQYHPEKSGPAGLSQLQKYLEVVSS